MIVHSNFHLPSKGQKDVEHEPIRSMRQVVVFGRSLFLGAFSNSDRHIVIDARLWQ